MISYLQAILLGIVQGITEWLPISSSGHLVLFQQWFGLKVPVAFDVILHVGTLMVVLLVFWKDILKIFKSLFKWQWDKNTKLLLFIILGSIPTGIIGLVFHDWLISLFSSILVVGIALLFTGAIVYLSKFPKKDEKLNWWKAVIVGVVQGLAIIPGISRSGSTISFGLLMKVKRSEIAKFSFLLSVPAIMGAAILEGKNLVLVDIGPMIVGTLTSVVVGYFALKYLLRLIKEGKFYYFSYYCWALGSIVLAFALR